MSSLAMICMILLNMYGKLENRGILSFDNMLFLFSVTLPSEKVSAIQYKDVLGYEPIVQNENTILQIDVNSSGETSDGH